MSFGESLYIALLGHKTRERKRNGISPVDFRECLVLLTALLLLKEPLLFKTWRRQLRSVEGTLDFGFKTDFTVSDVALNLNLKYLSLLLSVEYNICLCYRVEIFSRLLNFKSIFLITSAT